MRPRVYCACARDERPEGECNRCTPGPGQPLAPAAARSPFDLGDAIASSIDRHPELDFDTIMLGIGASIATLGGALPSPRTPCATFADQVFALLSAGRFDLCAEHRIQAEMELALVTAFGPAVVRREVRLGPKDRPDFVLDGRLVIEVKGLRHRAPDVIRQLERYAGYPQVEAIVLVTARAMRVPHAFAFRDGRRVPIRTLNLGRAWL